MYKDDRRGENPRNQAAHRRRGMRKFASPSPTTDRAAKPPPWICQAAGRLTPKSILPPWLWLRSNLFLLSM